MDVVLFVLWTYDVSVSIWMNKSGERRNLQVVDYCCDEVGKRGHRVVANLGRVDGMEEDDLDSLIRGLCRVVGRDEPTAPEITYKPAKAFGNVFVLHALWKDLEFDYALTRALQSSKRKLGVEPFVRTMVCNCFDDSASWGQERCSR